MSATIRPATADDLDRLLPHVRAFWAFERLPFDAVDVRGVLGALLADAALGRVLVAEDGGEPVAYAVLTWGYSLERGGRHALLDELYVRPDHRGAGLGERLIEAATETCRACGITRLHLEVDDWNGRAAALYRRLGFAPNGRALLTRVVE